MAPRSRVHKAVEAKDIVIIGSSFIGSECAASLKAHYGDEKRVHLIGQENHPLENVLGPEVAEFMTDEHLTHGVCLYMGTRVQEIMKDEEGNVKSVKLADNSEIPADLVIIGGGIEPSTSFLEAS